MTNKKKLIRNVNVIKTFNTGTHVGLDKNLEKNIAAAKNIHPEDKMRIKNKIHKIGDIMRANSGIALSQSNKKAILQLVASED
jgi:hypothetical protein